MTAAIVVCFDAIVEENDRLADDSAGERLSRRAVRTLERRFLIEDCMFLLRQEIEEHAIDETIYDVSSTF